ncbi:hypothetical protein BRADI_1g34982v3 [Brachypodium distachyon]|uniref:BUB1 N-terminal domain-containing protein n=1 Tax=Brachypodium distachyon TaxID=15368 RepID=A0A2K2DMS3_BRADI|nr:hypothetical protein BRADI_1g34982v3 [Brachypodium distachyon]
MGKAKPGPGETTQRRRMRAYESLDLDSAAALEPGSAQRLREAVRAMRAAEGREEARQLLRSAFSVPGAEDYAAVYKTWVAMEAAAGNVAAARELGTADEYAAFWIAYVAFELRHGGGAGSASARDAAVRATCAMAGVRLEEGGGAAGRPAPAPRCRWWTRLALLAVVRTAAAWVRR